MARDDWLNPHQQAESCIRLADLRAALDRRDDALRLYGEAVGALGVPSDLMRSQYREPEAERLEMHGRLLWAVSGHVFMAPG